MQGWSLGLYPVTLVGQLSHKIVFAWQSYSLLKFHPQTSTSEPPMNPITGHILKILQDTSGKISFIILDVFQVAAVQHEVFGMPILKCHLNKKRILVVPAVVSYYSFLEIGYLLDELCQKRLCFSITMFNMIAARQVAEHLEHGL
jgi:hypothetical protein